MANNEFGDFQTPLELAEQCLKILELPSKSRILEPTCGRGAFLEAAAKSAPESERIGLEINPEYSRQAADWGEVLTGNIFQVELPKIVEWRSADPLFIVGNPPWVTSSELKKMNSMNLPPKENFKKVKGLDALLGSSNFDVCEYVILKSLQEFSGQSLVLGMLCKTQVVRNVIDYAAAIGLPIVQAAIYHIDAMYWFGAAVDACWFTIKLENGAKGDYTVKIFKDIFKAEDGPIGRFGVVGSSLVSDIDNYLAVCEADGRSPYTWRSGLKHDASNVFELIANPNPTTKLGVELDLEPGYVFPLLKGTDIFRGRHQELSKWVIVPQLELGVDTSHLRFTAPKLWSYLESNADVLDGRKSSIYRNKPRFSVFGLGEYTFAPYKVAVSGLHKKPIFRLIAPLNGQPVILDDTCYLLPFEDSTEAAIVTSVLNSPECNAFIESLVFWDSKRPITKKLLSRIDLNKLPVDIDSVILDASELAKLANIPFDICRAIDLFGRFGQVDLLEDALF